MIFLLRESRQRELLISFVYGYVLITACWFDLSLLLLLMLICGFELKFQKRITICVICIGFV